MIALILFVAWQIPCSIAFEYCLIQSETPGCCFKDRMQFLPGMIMPPLHEAIFFSIQMDGRA